MTSLINIRVLTHTEVAVEIEGQGAKTNSTETRSMSLEEEELRALAKGFTDGFEAEAIFSIDELEDKGTWVSLCKLSSDSKISQVIHFDGGNDEGYMNVAKSLFANSET